ncbi:MAG: hypothetical protein AAGF24_03490, partial [Cyanobacteria bacterium P01_H01_bin.121]
MLNFFSAVAAAWQQLPSFATIFAYIVKVKLALALIAVIKLFALLAIAYTLTLLICFGIYLFEKATNKQGL